MLNIEQIRALEARVEKAVQLIAGLKAENAGLEKRIAEASRIEEQLRAANAELERKLAMQARMAAESGARIDELASRARDAEEKAAAAELRAADAEERAAAAERKAQSAESEVALYRERALTAERRVADLEARAEELRQEQERIERSLMETLRKLDSFEDMVLEMSHIQFVQETPSAAAGVAIAAAGDRQAADDRGTLELETERRSQDFAAQDSEEDELVLPADDEDAQQLMEEEVRNPADPQTDTAAEEGKMEEDRSGDVPHALGSDDAPFRGGADELDIF